MQSKILCIWNESKTKLQNIENYQPPHGGVIVMTANIQQRRKAFARN